MSDPVRAADTPYGEQVESGETYFWCACGQSARQPYCDGSHKGSGISPKVVTYEKDTTLHACGCQQSKNRPLCDGTHKSINE